jgi:hypothetical protein
VRYAIHMSILRPVTFNKAVYYHITHTGTDNMFLGRKYPGHHQAIVSTIPTALHLQGMRCRLLYIPKFNNILHKNSLENISLYLLVLPIVIFSYENFA